MSSIFKINLDFAGVFASVLCAIHCMAIPIVLSLGLANSNHLVHDHSFDILIISIGLIIACLSLVNDYKKHKSSLPLLLVFLGFCVLTIGLFKDHHNLQHLYFSLFGSSFVITAHLMNWKKTRSLIVKSPMT